MIRIGLLHPGAMGASVGAAASDNGHAVLWASQGRSAATQERARRGELQDVATVPEVLASSEIVLSVCPPHAAEDVAAEAAECGFAGLYVDCNAVSPDRTRGIQRVVQKGGADYVDGGIIGGPAWTREAGTSLYLSGPRAAEVSACFADSPLSAPVISERIGAASALKMGYAAFTKGSTALLTAILGMVEKEGVRTDLSRQWGDAFAAQTVQRVSATTPPKRGVSKARCTRLRRRSTRPVCQDGFHQAAAEVFRRLAGFKDHVPKRRISKRYWKLC